MRWSTAITLLISAVSISPATAQSLSSICDSYARNAVEFQRQNFEARCDLEGPEWNDNYNYRYDWCVNGQNYRTADRWSAWRRERIAQCREASKTPQVQLPPTQSIWVNRIDPITNDVVARVNRGIDAIPQPARSRAMARV